MDWLLSAKKIEKHFDGVYALRGASLDVAAGEVHVLMGENGAGKSTLAKIIAGVVGADSGEIMLRGQPVQIRHPMDAQRLGIGIVFQELDLFPNLSVAENIVVSNAGAGNAATAAGLFVNVAAMESFCRPFMDQVGLHVPPGAMFGDHSLAQMQLPAIARALSMNARLILMDEPTSALGDEDAARLFRLIRELKSGGVSIVYVSHKMHEIFQIADRISVMRDGQTIGTRKADETNIGEIITMMVGRELAQAPPRVSHRCERTLVTVNNLSTSKLSGVSFDLHAGEVLGVAGLVGSGRSELGEALFGLDPIIGGSIQMQGNGFRPRHVADAISKGLGLLPEDRKRQGLMMQMSVKENCTVSVLGRFTCAGFLRPGPELADARQALQRTRLKAASYDSAVSSLSGGNQQKVLLALLAGGGFTRALSR